MCSARSVYPTGHRGTTSALFTWPCFRRAFPFGQMLRWASEERTNLTARPHEIMTDGWMHKTIHEEWHTRYFSGCHLLLLLRHYQRLLKVNKKKRFIHENQSDRLYQLIPGRS